MKPSTGEYVVASGLYAKLLVGPSSSDSKVSGVWFEASGMLKWSRGHLVNSGGAPGAAFGTSILAHPQHVEADRVKMAAYFLLVTRTCKKNNFYLKATASAADPSKNSCCAKLCMSLKSQKNVFPK